MKATMSEVFRSAARDAMFYVAWDIISAETGAIRVHYEPYAIVHVPTDQATRSVGVRPAMDEDVFDM